MELSLLIIFACFEKVGKYVVGVRCADKLVYRKPHKLSYIRGKDIAEVACRYAEINLVSERNCIVAEKIAVSGEIINDLRNESSPVDRICAGKNNTVFVIDNFFEGFIREYRLNTVLSVVKVTMYSSYVDVVSGLRRHLKLLNGAYAVIGVKYHYIYSLNILVSFKSCFSCITARSNKNKSLTRFVCFYKSL